jgi:hypothetical protein
MTFTDSELIKIAYALECRYGLSDELADKIYEYLKEKTGEDYRL